MIILSLITQGSIIYGVRSAFYPYTCCRGIIISASCDIENCKTPNFYYLIAMDATDWLMSGVGYNIAYREKIKNIEDELRRLAEKNKLNYTSLLTFSDEEINIVISSNIEKAVERKKFREAYNQYKTIFHPDEDVERRREIIRQHREPAKKCLCIIAKNEMNQFYFLPEDAYRANNVKSTGLIIDLQAIEVLSLDDARRIQSPGIDYMTLPELDPDQKKRILKQYWLENEEDFVSEDGVLHSPWREHLMQRFSHGFVRIGLDSSSDNDLSELISMI